MFTTPGLKHILWRSSLGCGAFDTSYQQINIADLEPPTLVPACPTKPITLNAGPGECQVAWNAPPFMAMDNCPAGQYFGGLNRTGQICRLTNNWQINGGAGAWGVMFDLVNTSGGQLNLQEVSWLPIAANITHNIYYHTAPDWMGHIGYALATSNRVRLVQTCGAPYGPGCFFPIGCTTLCYTASDASGNVTNCTFDVCVNAYANPKRSLSCK
ncbi:MAG: HYR domain-containing protein [Saprospiraceae bacterium]|nr:HYR domain-containing protein [Saprospiraceae bacterium]